MPVALPDAVTFVWNEYDHDELRCAGEAEWLVRMAEDVLGDAVKDGVGTSVLEP